MITLSPSVIQFHKFRRTNDTLVTNVVLNGITVGDNVIVKLNDTVRDNVDLVVLNNRALYYYRVSAELSPELTTNFFHFGSRNSPPLAPCFGIGCHFHCIASCDRLATHAASISTHVTTSSALQRAASSGNGQRSLRLAVSFCNRNGIS
jgi:hypothetical protein